MVDGMNLIVLMILIFTIAVWCISNKIYNTKVNPCNCMNLIWLVCTFASQFGIFDFYTPNTRTYLYIFIMLISFSVCSIVFFLWLTRKLSLECKVVSFDQHLEINVKLLWLIFAIFIIFLLPHLSRTIPYIMRGEWKLIRNTFLAGASRGDIIAYIQSYAYNYIIRPFFITVSVIAAYATAIKSTKRNSLLILGFMGATVHAVMTGGRKEIFNFAVFILLALIISRAGKNAKLHMSYELKRKSLKDRIPYFLFAGGSVMIGFITSQRLHFGQSVLQTLFTYAIGPMSYLDLVVNNYSRFGIESGNYLFGKATFGFITGPIDTVIAVLTGRDFTGAEYLLNLYAEKYYYVSPTVKLNATSTIIYTFLRDFGTIGLVIGAAILALFVNLVLYLSLTRKSICWKCLLIICYFTLVFSVWRYTLVNTDFYMTVMWVILLFSVKVFNKEIIVKVR